MARWRRPETGIPPRWSGPVGVQIGIQRGRLRLHSCGLARAEPLFIAMRFTLLGHLLQYLVTYIKGQSPQSCTKLCALAA